MVSALFGMSIFSASAALAVTLYIEKANAVNFRIKLML